MARPLGSKNKLQKSEKDFVNELLECTQEQYKAAFLKLANSQDAYDMRDFLVQRNQLQKLVVPKPTELSIKHDTEDEDKMMALFMAWGDKEEEDNN